MHGTPGMPPRDAKPSPLSAEPNVTPMIDVLLVLLIIMLFIVPQQQRALTAHLADRDGEGPGAALVLEVGPGDRLALNQQPIPPAQLGARLRAVYAGRPDRVLMVRGDRTVRFQQVIAAMDSARGAGVRVLGIDPRR